MALLILIATLLVVSISCIWNFLEWVWFRPKKLERQLTQQGIPGLPYRLFHGDMKDTKKMGLESLAVPLPYFSHDYFPRVRPFLYRTITNYGSICLTWEGPTPMVTVGEAELVKEVLMRIDEFQKPKSNPLTAILIRGLVSYDGVKWTQHRKLINPAFHLEKLKLMLPAFYTSCVEALNIWENKVSNGEHEIDVCDELVTLSADSISRAAFGSSYKEGRRIFQLLKDQILVTNTIAQSVYFPGRRYLPTEDNKKMREIEREIRTLIRGIVEKRKKEREPKEDLLSLLMDSSSEDEYVSGKKSNSKRVIRITTEEIIDECKLFYFAGQETTSLLLTWTMILLSNHKEWQDRARDEVQRVFGSKMPDFDGLNHLKIVTMIFNEVLRLYSPTIDLRRTVVNDNTKLGTLTLPKGILVNCSSLHIHHDTRVWGDDAKEFNPERFSHGISKASKGMASFLGFGWGPRICIGSNFALVEAKMALSMILQRFTFQLSPSYVHAPSAFGLIHPQFGAPIIFHRL